MNPELQTPVNGQPVILLAEDDRLVRNLIQAVLGQEDYTVLSAEDGVDALEKSRNYPGEIQLLLSDIKMPRMDGLELSQHVMKQRPGIKVLLMSGKLSGEALVNPGASNFLRKPFMAQTLRSMVKTLLCGGAIPAGSS